MYKYNRIDDRELMAEVIAAGYRHKHGNITITPIHSFL